MASAPNAAAAATPLAHSHSSTVTSTKSAAYNSGVAIVPRTGAYGAPHAIVEDLDAANERVPTAHEPDTTVVYVAPHPGVLIMPAVVSIPASMGTLCEASLCAVAAYIVQPAAGTRRCHH